MKALPCIYYYCLQGIKPMNSDWKKKVLPNVEDWTLTVRPPHTANNRFIGSLIVYIATASHQWGRLPHSCINKWKMHEQTQRPFIEHHFPILVEPKFHSWGRCIMALTNMHSDLRFNPSSGLAFFLLVWLLSSSLFLLLIWGVTSVS